MGKKILAVLLVAAIPAAAWLGWKYLRQPLDLADFAWGNGRIEATEVNVATKLAGRLAEILVEEGNTVEAGQVLARMDTKTLEADLRQAQASVEQMRHKVVVANATVEGRTNDVEAARAVLYQRSSRLGLSSREARRTKELYSRGVISGEKLDIDQTTKQTDQAQLQAAKAQLSAAQSALEAARAGVLEARAAVASALARVDTIQSNIDDGILAAPVAGRVLYRLAEPGEVLPAGGNVLTLLDITNVYMTFFLPTEHAGRVALGAQARIVLDARPDLSIPARITFVSPQAQFTPKSVETRTEREKLMFRIKATIPPALLDRYSQQVKTGLPGVTWVRLDPTVDWPAEVPPLVGTGGGSS